ncbi:MAG: response regulator [Anaerolineales bacterium]|nr:response regulator [Anaerolineales bacterium]
MSATLDLQLTPPLINAVRTERRSILVVDDEPALCAVMGMILRLHGYNVRRAHSVAQAFECLEENKPDLILADVKMPETDGLTMIRQLRSEPEWSYIPTIVLSSSIHVEDLTAAYQAGADAFLAKPFTAQELQDVIEPLLNGIYL